MKSHVRLQIVLYGVLLLFTGMLTGIPFMGAIVHSRAEESIRAWRVVHGSLLMGGIMYLAIAGVLEHLALGARAWSILLWSLAFTAYVFPFALILGAFMGERGLQPGGTLLRSSIFGAFALSVLALFLAVLILLRGAYVGLRQATRS